jgi:hypothetical protein
MSMWSSYLAEAGDGEANKADLIGEGKTHRGRLAFVGSFGLRWRMF